MELVNVPVKVDVRSLTHSWDNSDWSFGWGCRCCLPKMRSRAKFRQNL